MFFKTEKNFNPILTQTLSIIGRSLSTLFFSGIFVGGIIVLQMNVILAKYDAQIFLGALNTSTVIREIGPLMISFLLAGKIGAFTAAELATMRVTEQIDAIECMGHSPLQYLVVPRFFGTFIASVLLLFIGIFVSIVGSLCIASFTCHINASQFLSRIPQFITPWTFLGALVKACIYGLIVGAVSCQKGFTALSGVKGAQGAQRIGQAVTQTSLYINFYIVLADFMINQISGQIIGP